MAQLNQTTIEGRDVLAELDELNSKFANDKDWNSSGTCSYRRWGNIVEVIGDSSAGMTDNVLLTANEYTTVATLPSEYAPLRAIPFTASAKGGTATIFGYVNTNGQIIAYSNEQTAYWNFNVVFIV